VFTVKLPPPLLSPLLWQLAESQLEVIRLTKLISSLEAASAGDASALILGDDEEEGDVIGGKPLPSGAAAAALVRGPAAGGAKVDLRQVRLQMQRQLKQQVGAVPWLFVSPFRHASQLVTLSEPESKREQARRLQELEGQLADGQQQLDATRALRAISQEALDQARWAAWTR
jgi:hypothetical protein